MDGGEEEEKNQDNTDNDISPKMARPSNDHGEYSSTLVLETSTVVSESQRDIEKTKGGCEEAKDVAGVYDEETTRSTTTEGDGQARRVDVKGVLYHRIRCIHFPLGSAISLMVHDENLHPVALSSGKFKPTKNNYEIHCKDLLAIVYSFQQCCHFFNGSPNQIIFYNDHKNLTYFQNGVINRQQAQ